MREVLFQARVTPHTANHAGLRRRSIKIPMTARDTTIIFSTRSPTINEVGSFDLSGDLLGSGASGTYTPTLIGTYTRPVNREYRHLRYREFNEWITWDHHQLNVQKQQVTSTWPSQARKARRLDQAHVPAADPGSPGGGHAMQASSEDPWPRGSSISKLDFSPEPRPDDNQA